MMYDNKMVVAVKSNGKILREFKDIVYIPFNSEYSILLKNLNNRRVEVSISIDGEDVLNNRKLIINANSQTEITRFVKDSLTEGNRFKFIKRTSNIENNRGIKIEDGIVRVSFKYESFNKFDYGDIWTIFDKSSKISEGNSNILNRSYQETHTIQQPLIGSCASSDITAPSISYGIEQPTHNVPFVASNIGITAPGSISNQTFTPSFSFNTENEEHVIILRLLGSTEMGNPVVIPITTKTKQKCVMCGNVNKSTSKFCTECGTSLITI